MKKYEYQYHKTLKKLSNEELIEAFNREVGIPGWGNSGGSAMRTEFLNRDFDSSLIISGYAISLQE